MNTYTPSLTNKMTNRKLVNKYDTAKLKYSNALAYTPSCVARDVYSFSLVAQPVCSRVSIALTDGSVYQILAGHMIKEYSNCDLIPEAQLLFGHENIQGQRLDTDQLLIWNNNVDFNDVWEKSFNMTFKTP
jgi:hypothetical protein